MMRAHEYCPKLGGGIDSLPLLRFKHVLVASEIFILSKPKSARHDVERYPLSKNGK